MMLCNRADLVYIAWHWLAKSMHTTREGRKWSEVVEVRDLLDPSVTTVNDLFLPPSKKIPPEEDVAAVAQMLLTPHASTVVRHEEPFEIECMGADFVKPTRDCISSIISKERSSALYSQACIYLCNCFTTADTSLESCLVDSIEIDVTACGEVAFDLNIFALVFGLSKVRDDDDARKLLSLLAGNCGVRPGVDGSVQIEKRCDPVHLGLLVLLRIKSVSPFHCPLASGVCPLFSLFFLPSVPSVVFPLSLFSSASVPSVRCLPTSVVL